jgi:SAM-dependent methyltransferase
MAAPLGPGDREFVDAVKAFLRPYEGAFNYETMVRDHLDISRFEPWVKELSRYKDITQATVLSSGCGSAGDLLAFMRAGAARVYGIEVNTELAALARMRFSRTEFADALDMRTYEGRTLPYESETFDIVFSMHVIEHTHDPELYLVELFRVLRPSGVLFLDMPNRYYPIEQHNQLRYIHYLPLETRDVLIRALLAGPLRYALSDSVRYKLHMYRGVHFPSPRDLVQIFQAQRTAHSLALEDAFFHSYSQGRVPYTSQRFPYLLGRGRTLTTFRIVVRRRDHPRRSGGSPTFGVA